MRASWRQAALAPASHLLLGFVALLLVASGAEARVLRITVERREPVLDGRPFGLAGAYEKLAGSVEFALVPSLRQNLAIVDLALAPRNDRGEVVFSADFYVLKPVDLRRGNGRLYCEVPNRGGKGLLSRLQYAESSLDPSGAAELGDGWLMNQGFAIAWLGWQWDVPDQPGLLRLRAPIATENGRPISGLVRAVVITDERQPTAPLGDRGHAAYAAIDPDGPDSALYVRDHRLDQPKRLARSSWRFADPTTVAVDGGFEPGRIYEVVYRSRDPRVAGCGLAATRDLVSFFKSEAGPANPLAGTRLAIAHGVSQSGRFLRHFLYEGFNEDEQGHRVFDGVLADVAGAGRGSFNERFAQPSRDGHQHWNVHYPTDVFPFSDLPETDPVTGASGGLLDRAIATHTAPRLFHVFGAYEYWNRAASLIHTDAAGTRDVDLATTSRVYFIASAQHGAGHIPPVAAGRDATNATNPNDYRPALRALVHALDHWVSDGVEPPPSRYARLADGTLAAPERAGWPAIPGVRFPAVRNEPARTDYGPGWSHGIATIEPPQLGPVFPALVPAVDPDGNDRAGIRVPEVAVPLATQTGWNWRRAGSGAEDALVAMLGSYLPFAWTRAERQAAGDPRPSVEERYASREDYLARIRHAADALVSERLLLGEDVPRVVERAAAHWQWRARAARDTALFVGADLEHESEPVRHLHHPGHRRRLDAERAQLEPDLTRRDEARAVAPHLDRQLDGHGAPLDLERTADAQTIGLCRSGPLERHDLRLEDDAREAAHVEHLGPAHARFDRGHVARRLRAGHDRESPGIEAQEDGRPRRLSLVDLDAPVDQRRVNLVVVPEEADETGSAEVDRHPARGGLDGQRGRRGRRGRRQPDGACEHQPCERPHAPSWLHRMALRHDDDTQRGNGGSGEASRYGLGGAGGWPAPLPQPPRWPKPRGPPPGPPGPKPPSSRSDSSASNFACCSGVKSPRSACLACSRNAPPLFISAWPWITSWPTLAGSGLSPLSASSSF